MTNMYVVGRVKTFRRCLSFKCGNTIHLCLEMEIHDIRVVVNKNSGTNVAFLVGKPRYMGGNNEWGLWADQLSQLCQGM